MQIFVYESCKYTFPQSVLDNMETRRRSCNAGTFLYTASCSCAFLHVGQTVCESLFLLELWDSVTHPRSTDDIQKPLLIPWAQVFHVENLQKWNEMHLSMKVKARDEDHDWKRNKRIGMKYPWNDHCQPFTMMSHHIQSFFCFSLSTSAPQYNCDMKWGQLKSGIKRRGKGFWIQFCFGDFLLLFFQEAQYKLFWYKRLHFCACCSGWAGAVLLVISVWTGCSLELLLFSLSSTCSVHLYFCGLVVNLCYQTAVSSKQDHTVDVHKKK